MYCLTIHRLGRVLSPGGGGGGEGWPRRHAPSFAPNPSPSFLLFSIIPFFAHSQILHESGVCPPGLCIGVTQPRRVAAVSVARRVAEEMGVEVSSFLLCSSSAPSKNHNEVSSKWKNVLVLNIHVVKLINNSSNFTSPHDSAGARWGTRSGSRTAPLPRASRGSSTSRTGPCCERCWTTRLCPSECFYRVQYIRDLRV
jgi:hypothetical protein